MTGIITPRQVKIRHREYWRVNIPAKIREAYHGKKTRHFKHKAAADDFAADMGEWREPLSGALAMERTLEKIAGHPLVREAAARNQAKQVEKESSPVSEIVRQVLASKESAGVRANSLASLTCSLKSFSEFCPKPISAITTQDIDAWLAASDLKPKTKKNRLVDVSNMFSWCMRRGIVVRNPATGVEPPRVAFKPAEIMPVGDIEKLLHTCQKSDPAMIGYLSLILFGGLRSKESARALPENVHDGIVDIGGDQTKLNVRRCAKIQPVLAAWLSVPGCEIGGKNLYNRFVAVRKEAGVTVPDNALRHTAVSCWIELIGAKDAAKMHGHGENMMMRHYANKVTAEEARRFEALRPLP